ncbi:hypothetical protein ACSFBF_06875 [Variovorax sp. ZT5P49]|uniref:hypothetical protein n=1 Tax=Variovorax sp. ZT5P49 TaxID=3443733 RepID=UPI003F46A561
MAGLLDFLSTDDAQLGLGLLAAGGPSTTPMDFGQRIAAGVGQAMAAKDAGLNRKLKQSQIDENTSQDALRRAQLERQARQDAYYLGGSFSAPGAGAASPASTGGSPVAAGGAPASAGAALKAAAGAPADAPPPGQGKFTEWSKQFNIPVDALVADYFSNGGKGIADMLFKRGTPDMQVTNGYAYDKNRVGPGYLPQLNISSNGQATQVQIGPDGQPVVSAPQGAVGTFGAYQNAQGQAAANWQEGTPVFNAQGQKVIPSRADLLNSSRAPAPVLPGRPLGAAGPGYAGGSASAAAGGQAEILNTELQRATQETAAAQQRGDAAAAARAQQDVAGIQRELQRLPGGVRPAAPAPLIGPGAGIVPGAGRGTMGTPGAPVVTAGNVAELSPQQQAENEANRVAMVDRAKAGVVRETASAATGRQMSQMQEAASLANRLLDEGPTGSGVGALVDRVGNFVGQPIKGASQAAQLKALGGWLVANVPRMEGPQSDRDVANYNTMAGQVGDETLPPSTRKAALQTVIALQNKYAAINGGAVPDGRSNSAPGTLPSGWTVKVK